MQEMETLYGREVTRKLKIWASYNKKLVSYNNHKTFLIKCRKNGILPQHILHSAKCIENTFIEDSPFTNKSYRILKRFQRDILNIEISFVHWKSKKLNSQIKSVIDNVKIVLNQEHFESYNNNQNKFASIHNKKTKSKQNKKFRILLEKQKPIKPLTVNNKWILNLSSMEVPREVQYLLSLGDKFNLPYNKKEHPIQDLIIDLECIVNTLEDNTQVELRNKCINIITNYLNSNKNKNETHKHILNLENKLKQFLRKSKNNIYILKADKGNTTVILNKDDYTNKANDILGDTETYKILKKNPTTSIQNKNNKLIDSLIENNYLSKEEGKKLKTNNALPPKIYFQPKIHKNGVPLRPIVSFIGSPLYNLTKYISTILSQMFDRDERYVRNSFEFVEDMKNIRIPTNYEVISLDVISLFTNIPTDVVKDIVIVKWPAIQDNVRIPLLTFLDLLNFVFENNYFQYNDTFYSQTNGLGMGNCLSPICADLVMQDLQNKLISTLPFKIPFFKRYVDDILTTIPKNQHECILNSFNTYHPKIQFTFEKEKDGKISFLDVLVIKSENGEIETNWYHKPTFSERYINFCSLHPLKDKINIINNLKYRAINLSSSIYHKLNLEYIEKMLIDNNYPISLIKKILYKQKNRNNIQQTSNSENGLEKIFYKLPYITGLTEQLKTTIEKHITSDHKKIVVAQKCCNTIKTKYFSKLKAKSEDNLKSSIVYRIPCNVCDKSYIGQTSRYLKDRLREHKNDEKKFRLKTNPTALVQHRQDTGHTFNFENTSILDRQENYKKRIISEMINIKKNNTVNKRTDIENLSASYFNIIDKLKQN